jgi:plastocyanin
MAVLPAGTRRRSAVPLYIAATTLAAGVLAASAFVATASSSSILLHRLLGINSVQAAEVGGAATVRISSQSPVFAPRLAAVAPGGRVTFTNDLGSPIWVRAAALSPASFALRLAPGASGSVLLTRPGLYHYYDARADRALHIVAGNQVIAPDRGVAPVRQGWISVLPGVPGLREQLTIPSQQDLFAPKGLVAVAGSTIVIANHDTDTHNFVVDPASPTGAAFEVSGTKDEWPSGWQRSLVVERPGLYHVYCTLHTRLYRTVDGWHVVVPRSSASGYHDHNPMDAWITVLPSNSQVVGGG